MLIRIHRRRLDRQLVTRDKWRYARARFPSKWQHINMLLTAKLWKMSFHDPMLCMKNRLIFGKHMSAGNIAKRVCDPAAALLVYKCGLPSALDYPMRDMLPYC